MTPTTLLLAIFVTLYALRSAASLVEYLRETLYWRRVRRHNEATAADEAADRRWEARDRRKVATALLSAWSQGNAAAVERTVIAKAYHDADLILAAMHKDPMQQLLDAAPVEMSDSEINAAAARAFQLANSEKQRESS